MISELQRMRKYARCERVRPWKCCCLSFNSEAEDLIINRYSPITSPSTSVILHFSSRYINIQAISQPNIEWISFPFYLLTDQSQTKLFRHQTAREKHARSIEMYMCIRLGPENTVNARGSQRRKRKMCGKENRKQQFYAKNLFISALGWWSKFLLCECRAEASKESERWWWRCDMDVGNFHRSRKAERHTGLCALVWLPFRITRQNSPTSMYIRAGYISAPYTYVSSLLLFRNNVDFRATSNIILGWSALCPCVYTTWIPSSRVGFCMFKLFAHIFQFYWRGTVRIQIITEVFPSAELLANSAAYNTRSLAMCAARNSCWQPKITCCARARARRRNTQKKVTKHTRPARFFLLLITDLNHHFMSYNGPLAYFGCYSLFSGSISSSFAYCLSRLMDMARDLK